MLFVDIEVYSDVPINEVPLEVYATHPSTKIILGCAAVDNGPVLVFAEDQMADLFSLFQQPLNAWNVGFEHSVLNAQGCKTPLSRWTDTMVLARRLGLPGSLKQCCKVEQIGLPADEATRSETNLIKKFCMPNGKKPGTPEEWEAFVEYCRKDVLSTRHIYNYIVSTFGPEDPKERAVWLLDQRINHRGIPIDVPTVRHAVGEVERLTAEASQRLRRLTGLENPNSVQQLHGWLKERGYEYDSLGKEFVEQALDDDLPGEAKEVLELRLSSAKSSVKKFSAMASDAGPDGRARSLLKYYAAHTGRWGGRSFQPQNLLRERHDAVVLETLMAGLPVASINDLAPCIRPMIAAPSGKKFAVCDLSAIENRMLMWLSGCDAGLDVFKKGLDPYKDFATRMFGVAYEAVTKAQRQICKPPVLGCGYGLGPGQEREMANGRIEFTGLKKYAENMGVELSLQQCREAVNTFRSEFSEVVDYWRYLELAFHAAVKTGRRQQVGAIWFGAVCKPDSSEIESVYAELPSGRRIHYMNPRAWQGSKGVEIRFDGLRNGQWWSVTAWGGVLTENIVQAGSRDVLVEGMLRAEEESLPVVLHCHDEIVAEVPERMAGAVEILQDCMSRDIDWAPGLPLAAEGWEGRRYAKH